MDFMKTFTELLHLMCLGKGDSPSFKVDKVSEPSWIVRKLEDLNALPRNEECLRDQPDAYEGDNQISIGVLDLLGVYYPGDRKVIIFDRLIKRCASSLGINENDLFEIVCCHELAHAATHLGLEQGPVVWHFLTANHSHSPGKSQPEIWHCFDYAPPQKREYYAQIYTYKLFDQRGRKDLIDCMEKLALTQPWIYQSYLGDVNIKISDLNADLLRDRKALFEEFWTWLCLGHEDIPTLSGSSLLTVSANDLKVIITVSSDKQYPRGITTVASDFKDFCSNRKPKPEGTVRYIYAIIIYWLGQRGYAGWSNFIEPVNRGSMISPASAKKRKDVEPAKASVDSSNIVTSQDCLCVCQLSRNFLKVLNRQQVGISSVNYPHQWVGWVRWKSQIAKAKGAAKKPLLTDAQNQSILDILENHLQQCAVQINYNALWHDTKDNLLNIELTLGEAQKLINLLMKYCYAYYFAEVDRAWMAANHWVARFAGDFHIPIDRIVLTNLKQLYPHMVLIQNKQFTGLQPGHANCNPAPVPWSRLECANCYDELQDFCRDQSNTDGFINPLEFEMARLWIP